LRLLLAAMGFQMDEGNSEGIAPDRLIKKTQKLRSSQMLILISVSFFHPF